jgi:DNA-binding MarR family transcriptional regulator
MLSSDAAPDVNLRRLLAAAVVHHESMAERAGVNPTDLKCLALAASEGPLTPTRLAELAGITSGAVTGVLDRLESGGWVRREPDPADRRSVVIRVDAARREELAALYGPLEAAAESGLRRRPAAERRAIASSLAQIADALLADTQQLRVASRGGMVGDTYMAPLAGATRGRLVFASGAPRLTVSTFTMGQHARMVVEASASRLRLEGTAGPDELIRARFEGPPPEVRATDGTVTIRYRRRALDFRSRAAEIALNGSIPWAFEVDGGITDLDADLRGLRLDGLEVRGGANHLSLELPPPEGTVRISIAGGASNMQLIRPAGTAAALHVRGGASRLRFDDRLHQTVSRDLVLRSDDFAGAADRYEVLVSGGTSNLAVVAR